MKKKKQKGLKLKLFKQGGLSNNWVQYQGTKRIICFSGFVSWGQLRTVYGYELFFYLKIY